MKLFLPVKDPTKAYVSNSLWLPKEGNVLGGVRVGPLKKALEFTVGGKKNEEGEFVPTKLEMWEESRNHIICPREFLPASEYRKYKFPFVDLRPNFSRVHFEDLVTPRDEDQEKAWKALSKNDNGILNLGCGKGKTRLAQKKIAQRGVPTLVIVPDGGMLSQWRESVLGSDKIPAGLRFDGGLGIIQADVFDWKRPLTIALVTTLALKIRDGKVPEELFRYFGQVIYDEVHQIGAPMFSQTAWPFYGDRIGLTATVQREDGLDPIFRYHIGEPFYADLKQDLIPQVFFQKTPAQLNSDLAIRGANVNMPVLRTMLASEPRATTYRYWSIKEALDNGRKILCLSHSRKQLDILHAMFPGSGLITKDTPREERMAVLREHQLCFAIARLGSVGVDDDRLDCLFWLTPFKSLIAAQQSIGRIQRRLAGKPHPVVTIFDDFCIPSFQRLCVKLKQTFKKWKFPFHILGPGRFPRDLPADIKAIYEQRSRELECDSEDSDDEEDSGPES